nr:MAG TPA: hypothetical protein [Caudoviricetes sp.]
MPCQQPLGYAELTSYGLDFSCDCHLRSPFYICRLMTTI